MISGAIPLATDCRISIFTTTNLFLSVLVSVVAGDLTRDIYFLRGRLNNYWTSQSRDSVAQSYRLGNRCKKNSYFESLREHCLLREQVSGKENASEITATTGKRPEESLRHSFCSLEGLKYLTTQPRDLSSPIMVKPC